MEGFKYIDIFATKGFEYVLVIFFLILMYIFLRWMNTPVHRSALAMTGIKKRIKLIDWFYLNDSYFYHQGHTWVKPEADDIVKIGIDDFARKLVGTAARWNLPEQGQYLHQGSKAWSVQVDGKSLSFLAPINGEVMQVNEQVNKSGEFRRTDPYENGWFMLIRVPRLSADLKNLLTGKMAYNWMQHTVDKLNQLMTIDTVPVLADGGQIKDCFLREIVPQDWHEMAEEFLLSKEPAHRE
jgi:glycine cleavage system H protein